MGILDGILGGLLGGNSNAGPLQSILGSVLGGGQAQQGQAQQGGLGGLLNQFQQAGLGQVAQSWVGNGPNQQVSPDQLHQVFGDQQVNQWSQQSGLPKHDLLSQLSQYLPHAVDKMTPQGQVPTEAEGGSAFDGAGVNLGTRTT